MIYEAINPTVEAVEMFYGKDGKPTDDRVFYVTTPDGRNGLIGSAEFLSFFRPAVERHSVHVAEKPNPIPVPAAETSTKSKPEPAEKPRKLSPVEKRPIEKADPDDPHPNISAAVREALNNGPKTLRDIWQSVKKNRLPMASEDVIVQNVFMQRRSGRVRRTAGTVSGSEGTWELVPGQQAATA